MKTRISEFNTETQSFTEKTVPILLCDPLRSLCLCVYVALLVLAMCTVAHAGTTNDITSYVQRGLFEEEANHNLDAAMQAYQAAVTLHDKDRKLVATAIFRLGECLRKQGKTNEANGYYQRVLTEFPDQKELAGLSAQYVGRLPQQLLTSVTSSNSAALASQLQDLSIETAQAEALWKRVKELGGEDRTKFFTTVQPDPTVIALEQKKAEANSKLRQLAETVGNKNPNYKAQAAVADEAAQQLFYRVQDLVWGIEQKYKMLKEQEDALKSRLGQASGAVAKANEPATTSEEDEEIRKIKEMIQDSPDLINAAAGALQETPLQQAAGKGQLKVIEFLVGHGANLEASDANGSTPLIVATENGHRAAVELLLAKGANVNAAERYGATSLHAAAGSGFKSIAEVLLAHKADVNALDRDGTPLHSAAINGKAEIIELLLEHGAKINAINSKGRTALMEAANGRTGVEVEQVLCKHNADVNHVGADGLTALLIASEHKNAPLAKLLLEHGADVNAAAQGHFDIPAMSDRTRGYHAINFAIDEDAKGVAQVLVDFHANLNAKFSYQAKTSSMSWSEITPLIQSIILDREDWVKWLLERGADPNIADYFGKSALLHAVVPYQQHPNPEIVKLLCEHRADVNQVYRSPDTKFTTTPLLAAVAAGNATIANILLDHGAKTDVHDSTGDTPLCRAALFHNTNLVALLIKYHADVNATNAAGFPPIAYAKSGQQNIKENIEETLRLLRAAGANENFVRLRRITVKRGDRQEPVFFKESTNWNHFTLLELVATVYAKKTDESQPSYFDSGTARNVAKDAVPLSFPDLSRVEIDRLLANGKTKKLVFNALDADHPKDLPLAWGDVVEIPEKDHPISAEWHGLPDDLQRKLIKALQRQINFRVKGTTIDRTVWPPLPLAFSYSPDAGILTPSPNGKHIVSDFFASSVIDKANVLRSSSDIHHIKIISSSGAAETVFDLGSGVDVPWLKSGDAVEIPDRDSAEVAK